MGAAFFCRGIWERVEKVRREMGRRGIDVLLVSSPPNITYLTGYDMIWYYLTSPVSVAVHADSGQTLFFEVPYHQPTVEWHAVVDDAEYFEDGQVACGVDSQCAEGSGVGEGERGCRGVESGAERGGNQRDKAGLGRCGRERCGRVVGSGPGQAYQVGGGGRGDAEGGVHSGQGHGDGARTHSAGSNGNRAGGGRAAGDDEGGWWETRPSALR